MTSKITTTKKVSTCGNSIVIPITEEASMLGVTRGDLVEVTIKRKEVE